MTIRVYPSRLEGEPLEIHETTGRISIAEWMLSVAPEFSIEATELHPTIRVNGEAIDPQEWALSYFGPSDQVDVYIEAKGAVAIAIVSVVLAVIAVTMAMSMRAAKPQSRKEGTSIDDPGILANQVRWGDPIPETAGAPRTYPDYILPPRRYFESRTQQWVDSLVCIGMGEYLLDPAQVFIGDTSAPTLGENLEVTFFEPGETIPAPYSDWWHTPEEVGFTTLGGTGMTLGPATRVSPAWSANLSFSGASIAGSVAPPASWEAGLIVNIDAEHPLVFSGNTVQSALLDTLELATGDEIELTGDRSGEYTISAIYAGSGGSPGAPAIATGSAAPARLDFGVTPAALEVVLNGTPYEIALTSDAANLAALVVSINSQLNGSPIRAREVSGALELFQIEPYTGGSMALTGDVATLLGTPSMVAGVATTSPVGTRYAVSGADFGNGTEIASAGRTGMLYTITGISGSTITVAPPDVAFWTGFPGTVSDATSSVQVDSGSLEGGWIGPFAATPQGEVSDSFEVDVFHPQGLIRYNKKGKARNQYAGGVIQWREMGSTTWSSQGFDNELATADQIGFTYRISHDTGRYEVRVKAYWAPSSDARVSNKQQWSGLRSRIVGAPTSYPGMTVAHVRLRSGDKVSGAVENKLSIRAMRKLPTIEDPNVMAPTRDIAPFFVHMMNTVGYGRDLIDMPHITALHEIWRDRGDTFDLSANGSSTLKTVANYCLQAGFAELTLRRGLISAARDAYRMGSPPRIYSPQEMVSPLVETTQSIMPDDIDGVDIEYVDYLTGRTLTEQYRLIGDQGRRVEKIQAPGVTGRTQAWRLAARRRRMAAYRRTVYKGTTELTAMNSYYMDYVGLQDGIPEWGQSAFVIDHDGAVLTLSEDVLPIGGEPVVMLRRPDGTATPPIPATISGRRVTLAAMPPDVNVSSDPNAPTVVYIGRRTQVVHEALMTEVRPSGEARVEFQAVNMDNRVYLEDDMGPDQVILTSGLYPIIFDDSLAPSAVAPGVYRRNVPGPTYNDDAMGIAMIAPSVFRQTVVRYLTYDKAEPEAIGVAMLAPSVSRVTEVRYLTYAGEPESLAVAMLPPAVSRRNHPVYTIPEESLAIAMLAPTVTRTNT